MTEYITYLLNKLFNNINLVKNITRNNAELAVNTKSFENRVNLFQQAEVLDAKARI